MTTLADLIDSVVNGAGYRSPVVNAIANQRPSLPAVKQFERERALALSGPQGNAQDQMSGAYAPQPAPTIENGRYPGADALQFTGLPQLRSGVQHAANSYALRNDPQASADEAGAALPDIALGGLVVLGMLGGSGESLSGPRAVPQMPMQQLNFGRLWESEGAPIVPHDLAFDGARGSYPEGALNNDLDRWVMGGIRSRASELPTLIERQRGFMPGHDMESLIRMANHTRPGEFANILDTDLGEFGVGGKLEGTPLLGTPDIAADPLANTARPGFTRLPELPQRMANRADARWPMFGTLPPEPVTPLPVNPTRELGRAADGSVLPVRPAQPFRQSFVGGSGDLRDAAGLGGNDGSHALDPGAMTALRRELREHDFPVPADTASLPAVDIPLGDLRPGRIGTADAADARQYAAMGSEAPPILVRRQGAGWHIIDGNRRAAAARIKGAPTVRALDATDLFRAQSAHNVGQSFAQTPHSAGSVSGGPLGNRATLELMPGARRRMQLSIPDLGFADDAGKPATEGHAAASVEFLPHGEDAWYVNGAYVRPDLRGQRIGVALYEELIARAQQSGIRRIVSDSQVSTDAQRVWDALARRGYKVTERSSPYGRAFAVEVPSLNSTNHAAVPLGIGVGAGLSELPRRRARRTNQTQAPPSGGFFMHGAN